jgi:hypothetical protein
MKTTSEFADVYLDIIRRYGISSALQRDNAQYEMSQQVKQVQCSLVIADQWTGQNHIVHGRNKWC